MRIHKLFWVYALSSAVYFSQGIESLPSQGIFYYLKESLNYPAEKIMLITSIITLAWLVKPFIGYLIDNSFSKKLWIVIACVLSILCSIFLGVFSLPVVILIALLLINSTFSAFRDVAVDGIMCVEGKLYNATGRIQSIQWISISLAGLLTGIAGGYIAQKSGFRLAFLCLAPFYIFAIIAAFSYQQSPQLNTHTTNYLFKDLKKLFTDKNLVIVGLFIFLYNYSPSFGTPLFFIQRDVFKWGKVWIGAFTTLGTAFQIAGALLYFKFSQRINLKKWLFVSVFLGALTTLSYLYYTPVSAVIYNILYSLTGMFIFLMLLDFMARNTLAGLEATSFAFLCSVNNIALTASNLSGAFLLPKIRLNWLIIISAATSFLCLPLINKIQDKPKI